MKKKLVLLLVMITCLFTVVGCDKLEVNNKSNNKSSVTTKVQDDTVVGSYELVEFGDDGATIDGDQLKELGLSGSLVVKKDKTAVLKIDDEVESLTYDEQYFMAQGDDDSEKIKYTYNDGKLTLSDNEEIMVFKKK